MKLCPWLTVSLYKVRHIFIRCRMLDIADITVDVDAQVCLACLNKTHQTNYKLSHGDNCSLSLWRVVRGIKLMYLASRIHGLFIT